ncbi:hypothetical protein ACKKBG_A29975 [Auxenochlorella protothecoides x Auxenochlorella symbiontica]
MAGEAANSACGLPYALSNFQGNFACDSEVLVGRPKNIGELQTLVESFPKVKANGVGGSWWKQNFCAGNDSQSINIVMTELQTTLDSILSPPNPEQWRGAKPPSTFPIQVDEQSRTVTVAAGVPQRVLLDYLSEYRHGTQPAGWTLPAFSWFIDQTIGGAVATATHGSSMRYGSLSSQVVEIAAVLANGTLATFSAASDPHLFKAFGVSAGRLGIIVKLKMTIIPQQAISRSKQDLTLARFADQVTATQEAYKAAKAAKDNLGVQKALFSVHETQALWLVERDTLWRVDYQHLFKEPEEVLENLNFSMDPTMHSFSGPNDQTVFAQATKAPLQANRAMTTNPAYWGVVYSAGAQTYVRPGTFETRKAYMSVTETTTRISTTLAPYIQMEVAIPLEIAGTCLKEVNKVVYGRGSRVSRDFRNPALIRFVSGEPFYLSPTHGGPRMYVNIEDWLTLSGTPNKGYDQVLKTFRGPKCQGRLHWGKGGWPEYASCFDGATEYPDSWCHFGCAVQTLDPYAKFEGVGADRTAVWTWNATRNGTVVPFDTCCTDTGFSPECTCASRTDCHA